MAYFKPYIIVFGGHADGNVVTNDTWVLAIDSIPFKWIKLDFDCEVPLARYYHSAAFCQNGSCSGMIIIYGGRTFNDECLNDVWGLRMHRDGKWDWIKQQNLTEGKQPTPRYQV
jgi:protein phosphatase